MPRTDFQKQILGFLAKHRSPNSHAGGGAVLNRSPDSPRFSSDMDFFRDAEQAVATSALADAAVLTKAGFEVVWLVQQRYMYQATVQKGDEQVGLDWVLDSAFRFFPVTPDPEFGYCLHQADLATNKMLALAGREKIRDYIDILHLHDHYLTLGAVCWAACGKDPGFNPVSLLQMAKRHVKYRPEDLEGQRLTKPLQLPELKEQWFRAVEQAEAFFPRLPATEIGCLYLDATGKPVTPDPAAPRFSRLVRRYGALKGAWPTVSDGK